MIDKISMALYNIVKSMIPCTKHSQKKSASKGMSAASVSQTVNTTKQFDYGYYHKLSKHEFITWENYKTGLPDKTKCVPRFSNYNHNLRMSWYFSKILSKNLFLGCK